ncbi:AMP-binding protein [Streptomyces sp. M19]
MEPVTDPATGRTTSRLLERFDTITYGELWERVGAVAAEWRHHPATPWARGRRRGSRSHERRVRRGGSGVRPLRRGVRAAPGRCLGRAPGAHRRADRTARARGGRGAPGGRAPARGGRPSLGRIVVLGHRREVTAHRERLDSARHQLASLGRDVALDTLASVVERAGPASRRAEPRRGDGRHAQRADLHLGSTGTPKGAIYTERIARQFWVDFLAEQETRPCIVLNYMPLSHMMGLGVLFGTLAKGGTAYFVAASDLSTLFEDLSWCAHRVPHGAPRLRHALPAPPRRGGPPDRGRRAAERADHDVREELREKILGGRLLWAASGSARSARR